MRRKDCFPRLPLSSASELFFFGSPPTSTLSFRMTVYIFLPAVHHFVLYCYDCLYRGWTDSLQLATMQGITRGWYWVWVRPPKNSKMYLGVWISLDNDAWEKLLLLFVFCWRISIRMNMMVCSSMCERSPLLPKKRFVWACLDTILQAELPATFANPAAVWCDT